jgi:hypothetical protein
MNDADEGELPSMTLEELEESLPNGLHDAQICKIAVDYNRTELTLDVRVWIGLLSQPRPDRDHYRSGAIVFRRVYFYSVEPPEVASAFKHPGPVSFSCERMELAAMPQELAASIPSDMQCYSLFVQDWISHIHICAAEVNFSWLDGNP